VKGKHQPNGSRSSAKAKVAATNEPPARPESVKRSRDLMIAKAVLKATQQEQTIAKRELGRDGRDIVPPLILGPQRYRDPGLFLPPDRWRPSIGGSGPNAAEKVPFTQDVHYKEALETLDALDAAVGLPADD
jgi:hypothetical protein